MTLIPTHGLRFVERQVPTDLGSEFTTTKRILQQLFRTTGGHAIWRDVPVVDETEVPS